MFLNELDIPEKVIDMLEKEGYEKLWPPQEEAIKAGLLKGENIIVSTPTASGKTLLAILIASKHVVEKGGKVVYVTPLRALASEKYHDFSVLKKAIPKLNIKISTGDYDSKGEYLGRADIIILTNEKFDSLIRHSASWMKKVNLFIFDEIHMLGDDNRGGTLEFSITNVLNMWRNAQILALSATISNHNELAEWLGAKVVKSEWRPVKLKEGVYFNGYIFFSDHSVKKLGRVSGNPALDLSMDGIEDGGQVLVFAETRKKAVNTARKLSPYIEKKLEKSESLKLSKLSQEKLLSEDETPLGKTLKSLIQKGVAFHHAGLPHPHRKLIEDAFKAGLIKVLVATPTLAAGVNLPARRVVILSPFRYSGLGYEPISIMEFKQMAGRAGRPKYDKEGEAILVSRDEYMINGLFERYIRGKPEPITSKLDRKGITAYILAYMVANPDREFSEIKEFFEKTLLRKQKGLKYTMNGIVDAIKFLATHGLIMKGEKDSWSPTKLGRRISTLYITPETGIILRDSLDEIKRSSDLHLSALLTIVSVPDFEPKFGTKKVEEVTELVSKGVVLPQYAYYSLNEWARSFLALKAWIEEKTEPTILEMYGVEPGDLYRAVESAGWICYSFSEIAKVVGDERTSSTLKILEKRIKHGIKPELVELTSLEEIGRVRGRILYNAGIRKIEDLAKVDEKELAKLPKIGPKLAKKLTEKARSL